MQLAIINLLLSVVGPIIMLILGIRWLSHPKKEIGKSGFRTKIAQINQETWDTAQQYNAQLTIAGSIVAFVAAIVINIVMWGYKPDPNLSCTLSVVAWLVLIMLFSLAVEIRLRFTFEASGNKKIK